MSDNSVNEIKKKKVAPGSMQIGSHCRANHARSIVIGEIAESTAEQQLVIEVGGIYLSAAMSYAQYIILYSVLEELFQPENITAGIRTDICADNRGEQ